MRWGVHVTWLRKHHVSPIHCTKLHLYQYHSSWHFTLSKWSGVWLLLADQWLQRSLSFRGVEVWTCHLQWGTLPWGRSPVSFIWDQAKHSLGYPFSVCLRGSWHDLVNLLWAALLPVRGWHPPAILAAHLPTPLPTSQLSLVKIPALWFFQGGHLGAGMVASSSTTLMILGGHISSPPQVRALPYSTLRWAMCAHCLPKRANPCLHFGFLKETAPGTEAKGLSSSFPRCHPCNPGEAITAVPLTAVTRGLPFQAPCPLPLARDTGREVPNFGPSDEPLFRPQGSSPGGVTDWGVTWARQGKGGATIPEGCKEIPWLVSVWWAPKIWWHLPAGVRAITQKGQRHPPCINPLSTPWILGISLSCFCRSRGEMWGHPKQVTIL